MRLLPALLLCSLPLAAQAPLEQYLPGHDKDLYHREKAERRAGKKNEASVEIRGHLDPETLRQLRFQEFMAWFIPDLHRFLGRYGEVATPEPEAVRLTEPPAAAKVYPLGKASF